MVMVLLFCSGATALVHEVLWSKFLSQLFGSTIYAQTVVLATFMGGLALGNSIFGRWAHRSPQPVQAYGYLEIALGVYAFAFPVLHQCAERVFTALGSYVVEQPGLLLGLKGVLSTGLLLVPTILMGGTLPLLAAWLQTCSSDPSRRSAAFYSVNTLGAAVGAALAGFWLAQAFGLVRAVQMGALANLIIGGAAALLSRMGLEQEHTVGKLPPVPAPAVAAPETLRWASTIVALTGAVAMGLEVLSSRALALVFGPSLQTFAVVLMAFILGTGLGSAWIASPRHNGVSSERRIVGLLCLAAAWLVLLLLNIERLVDLYRIVHTWLARTPVGYLHHQLFAISLALVLFGFPAACVGAVLPLMIRAVSSEGAPLGERVGSLLTWNTLGAMAGALSTGFVLMPNAGLRNAFGALALALALGALLLARRRGWGRGMMGAAGTAAFAGCLLVFGDQGWRCVLSSGVFRLHEAVFDPNAMALRKQHVTVAFYEDAPDATVSVEHADGVLAPAEWGLRINGKADAGTGMDLANQLLLAHLPMLVRPDAKEVFVVGMGSGITAGALLAYPTIDRIDVAENCEPVIRAARIFRNWNHDVLDSPRTHLWHDDARTVLKLRAQLYDVIISEPSNPWTAGVGGVFAREHYELAASRLKPDGIMSQWFHTYEMDDDILALVLRTFSSVFPVMEVWDTGTGDIVMLGSMHPWRTGPDVFQQGFAIERVRMDMAMIDIQSPASLLARQLASQRTGFAIAGDGPIESDDWPKLEYAAPRALYLGIDSRMLDRFDERTRQQLLAPIPKRLELAALPALDARLTLHRFGTVNKELGSCLFARSADVGVPCVFRNPLVPGLEGETVVENADPAARLFAAGELETAEQLAAATSTQHPRDAQAVYLLRVIEREKQLREPTGSRATVH